MTGSIITAVTWGVLALVWSFLFGYETKRRQVEQTPADSTSILCDVILIIISCMECLITFSHFLNK
jgi:heme/copper-type cytochrome/quinol oxidase subunit 2